MKSVSKILCLLAAGSMLTSCNEKISPSLQSGSSATVPTVTAPDEYYFRVTNNSPTVLNYKLHRTGDGNKDADCEITSTTSALSNDLYVGESSQLHDSKTYDISCFMEAEELAMQFNGLSFNIEASKNTCEYIGYAPFSYYDDIPGSSTSTYQAITCDEAADTVTAGNTPPPAAGTPVIPTSGGFLSCNEMVSTSLPSGSANIMSSDVDPKDLCKFDYLTQDVGNKQNCDEGTITIQVTDVTSTTDATTGTTSYNAKAGAPVVVKCGGKASNCVGGAINNTILKGSNFGMIIHNTVQDKNFAESYSLDAPSSKSTSLYAPNINIVNYRRGLAALDLNYIDYTTTNEINWGNTTYNKMYDPNIMEKFAANKYPDGVSQIITSAMVTAQINTDTVRYGRPYASDPFLGHGTPGSNAYRVNPFYTFYCMDRAFEIKARIRMVVREWDRVFPSSTGNMELISDAHVPLPPSGERRMDIPFTEEESVGDPGLANLYNDIADWDDYAPLMRSDTSVTSAATMMSTSSFVLQPMVGTIETGGYNYNGWWDSGIFPKIKTE